MPDASPPQRHVAVVVLNWNGAADTIACVESVLALQHRPLSVIICDNASTDDSAQRLSAWGEAVQTRFPEFTFRDRSAADPSAPLGALAGTITFLQAGWNGGYAAGNNVGLRAALGDISVAAAWVLNNDVVVDPDALTEALARLRPDNGVGLVGSTLLYMERPDLIQCQGGGAFSPYTGVGRTLGMGAPTSAPLPADEVRRRLAYVNGAAALVSREWLETVGLMTEDYFLYWEELDWVLKARGRFSLDYAPQAIVRHKVGASIGTKDGAEGSALSQYYLNRNRIRLCARYAKVALPFVYAQLSWRALSAFVRGRRRRAAILVAAMLGIPGPKSQ